MFSQSPSNGATVSYDAVDRNGRSNTVILHVRCAYLTQLVQLFTPNCVANIGCRLGVWQSV